MIIHFKEFSLLILNGLTSSDTITLEKILNVLNQLNNRKIMEKEYQELIKQHPFLQDIVEQIHNIDRMDERNWDNMFQKDLSKYLRILKILKDNKLI